MDKEQGMILAKLRFERAKELLEESKELLDKVEKYIAELSGK